jgi:hypothetical protein
MKSHKFFAQDGLKLWSFQSLPPEYLELKAWATVPGQSKFGTLNSCLTLTVLEFELKALCLLDNLSTNSLMTPGNSFYYEQWQFFYVIRVWTDHSSLIIIWIYFSLK